MTETPLNDQTHYEAVYIAENFGIPFAAALKIVRERAEKVPRPRIKRTKQR